MEKLTFEEIQRMINIYWLEAAPKVILMNLRDYNRLLDSQPLYFRDFPGKVTNMEDYSKFKVSLLGVKLRLCLNVEEGEIEIY